MQTDNNNADGVNPSQYYTNSNTGKLPSKFSATKLIADSGKSPGRQYEIVVFIGCLSACVLNTTPGDIYNDVVIINNYHYIIVMLSY